MIPEDEIIKVEYMLRDIANDNYNAETTLNGVRMCAKQLNKLRTEHFKQEVKSDDKK